MTAFTAIANMVRNSAETDLKDDQSIQNMVMDLDRLEEIEDGTLRAEKREELAQRIIAFLLGRDYITEEYAFDLLNKEDSDYGYANMVDVDFGEDPEPDEDDMEDDEEEEF